MVRKKEGTVSLDRRWFHGTNESALRKHLAGVGDADLFVLPEEVEGLTLQELPTEDLTVPHVLVETPAVHQHTSIDLQNPVAVQRREPLDRLADWTRDLDGGTGGLPARRCRRPPRWYRRLCSGTD